MAAPQPTRDSASPEPDFLSSHQGKESRPWLPWIIASVVVVVGIAALFLAGGSHPATQTSGTGMAPAVPYAVNLPLTNLEMSQATSFSGAKVTYLDGQITNTGNQTITGITVQIGFHNDLGRLTDREVSPLNLIRTREPYVDTEAVSADPIGPGQSRDFRLIFDTLPSDWNQQEPEVRIVGIRAR